MKNSGWLKRGVQGIRGRSGAAKAPVSAVLTERELTSAPAPGPDPTPLLSWWDEVAPLVHSDALERDVQQRYEKCLAALLPHVRYIQHSGQEYFEAVQRCVADLLEGPRQLGVLQFRGVHERVLFSLTAAGRRADILLVLADLQDNGTSYSTSSESSAGQLKAVPTYLPLLSGTVEPWLLNLTAVDLPVKAQLTRFEWTEDGLLDLGGWAYLPGISPADCVLEACIRSQDSSTGSALAVQRVHDPCVDLAAGDRWRSYAEAGFTIAVDTRAIPDLLEPGGSREWVLHLTLRSVGFSASDLIRVRDADRVPRRLPVGAPVDARTRVIGLMDAGQGLRLKAVRYSCVASSLTVDGNAVRVGFGEAGNVVPEALYLDAPGEPELKFEPEANGTHFILDAASVAGAFPRGAREHHRALRAVLPNGRSEHVGWVGSGKDLMTASEPSAAIRAECTGYGYLQLSFRPQRVTLSSVEMRGDGAVLVLEGRLDCLPGHPAPVLPALQLMTARNTVKPSTIRWLDTDGRFRTEFSLLQDKWGYGESAVEPGHYRLLSALCDDHGVVGTERVPALGPLLNELPLRFQHTLMNLELVGEANEQDLVLRVSAPKTEADRTAWGRSLAIADYSQSELAVNPDVVLFETFEGKSCSDSGRAISDELGHHVPGLRRYWTVADFSVPVPAGCTPVLRESTLWFRLLATAAYLVNNNNFPHYFRKRPGQYYVQTWHGTPLKRIGADTPVAGSTASYRALITREAAVWDMLLAQNEFASETLTAAFGYRGEPAVFGYPRNDALADETRTARRAEVRRQLGVEDARKVLLYVPTWRDSGAAACPYLDFDAAAEQLGPHYVLLYRGHHKVAGRRNTTGQSRYVDVTAHPEINDLYLAADLLVTDYSSAMFDFCVTGKPMYFLTPDLAYYRDSERGFYFDFEEQAPGPLVATTGELVSAIQTNEAAEKPYPERYRGFVRRYAPFDDGAAALRAIKAVWG